MSGGSEQTTRNFCNMVCGQADFRARSFLITVRKYFCFSYPSQLSVGSKSVFHSCIILDLCMWISRGTLLLVQTVFISSPTTFAVELKCSSGYCEVDEAFTIRNKEGWTCHHSHREVSRLFVIQCDFNLYPHRQFVLLWHLWRIWTLMINLSTVSQVPSPRLTLRRLMWYIYGAPILDVFRSHTTTQHSR